MSRHNLPTSLPPGYKIGPDGKAYRFTVKSPVFPEGWAGKPVKLNGNHSQGTAPKPKHRPLQALEGNRGNEKPHSSRRLVRITCFRVRRQDPDNSVAKWHVDALRLAGIIEDDTEDHIKLEIVQVQVGQKAQERTVIHVGENY